jgi:hypothetical protein
MRRRLTVDHELTGGEGTDHDETGTHTGEETTGTELTSHGDETGSDALSGLTLGLVDLGQEGVGGLGDLEVRAVMSR